MGLDIQRILDPTQVLDLAPILADLLKAALATAPHYRPVAVEELGRRVHNDTRFGQRALLVAFSDGTPCGWCHLEPLGLAQAAGDLYPYAGAQIVFQPGLPHVHAGDGYSAVVRALLYAACQIRAQQGAAVAELYAPADSAADDALRAEGFQPVDAWATYVTGLSGAKAGRAPLHVSSVKAAGLDRVPALLREVGLLAGDFEPSDLAALIASCPDFDAQGLLLAQSAGEIVGYAAVMVDRAYVAATGRKRAWLGFGPFGLAALPGPEHAERIATLVSAARISAFCRGATELAFVANAEGRQPVIWAERGFEMEVPWRRWRTEL